MAHHRSNAGVDLVLLSDENAIFETVRNAVHDPNSVWRAGSADEAMDLLVSGRCGVLVVDLGTLTEEPTGLVEQVGRQFPDVVVVAAGRQGDESRLAGMISEGLVYRFMHKPLSANRAGMFLDHAIQNYAERRERSGLVQALLPTVTQLPPRIERRYWYAAAAAIVVVLAGLLIYVARNAGAPTPADSAAAGPAAVAPGAGVPPEELLAHADAALAAGRLESPAGDNALDLYRDVLLVQPREPQAQAGLDRVAGLLLARAHAESVAQRGDEARRLVRRVLEADPANPLALAMQARLEAPLATASSQPESPPESFTALLRREFAAPARARPRTPPVATPAVSNTSAAVAAGAGAAAAQPDADTAPQPAGAGPADSAGAAMTETPVAPAATEPAPAADPAGSGPSLVPLREFTRTSTAEPEYPDAARRKGTEGWVRLEFTVSERGRVRDIVVVAAEPRGVFDDAASSALARWRFRPPVAADGQPVALRTTVQLRFELQD